MKTPVRLSRRKRVLLEASLFSLPEGGAVTPGGSQNLFLLQSHHGSKEESSTKRIASSMRPGPWTGPDSRHLAHTHPDRLHRGGMDTARAARRPAGVPAQTTVPPPRRRGSHRIQLRAVLHVPFCNLIFLLIFYKNFTPSSIF